MLFNKFISCQNVMSPVGDMGTQAKCFDNWSIQSQYLAFSNYDVFFFQNPKRFNILLS